MGGSTNSSDNTWDYDYDDDGNLIDVTAKMQNDAAKKLTYRYCWTAKGLLQRVDPIDVNGNSLDKDTLTDGITEQCSTAAPGYDTLYSYDSNGQLTNIDAPGAHRSQSYTYDALSRVRTVTDGRGMVTTYTYDALDHVIKQEFNASGVNPAPSPNTATVQWTYDPNGNRTQIQDPTGTETFGYDELNRRVAQNRNGVVKSYAHDPADNLKSYNVAGDPASTVYTYNAKNLVISVNDPRSSNDVITFDYNKHDNRIRTRFPMPDGNDLIQRAKYTESKLVKCIYSFRAKQPSGGR